MKEESEGRSMGQVIEIDEARIRDHLGEMARGRVEETLNAMLIAHEFRGVAVAWDVNPVSRYRTVAHAGRRHIHSLPYAIQPTKIRHLYWQARPSSDKPHSPAQWRGQSWQSRPLLS